ncbi:MAG: hypothetical protein AAGU17_01800 [Anaerolineaceae bacterium]
MQLHSTQVGEELLISLAGCGQVAFAGTYHWRWSRAARCTPRRAPTSHRVSTPALSRWCMP